MRKGDTAADPGTKAGHGDVPNRVFALCSRAYTRVNQVISISPSQRHVTTNAVSEVTTQSAGRVSPCPVCPHSQNDLERNTKMMTTVRAIHDHN
jgi:hypothetical protein